LARIRQQFEQAAYRMDRTPCFPELLETIDRGHWREEDRKKLLGGFCPY
jgi:hypothetical protein